MRMKENERDQWSRLYNAISINNEH
jgi:hypothetical protein